MNWDRLKEEITVQKCLGAPLPMPTDEDLDSLEAMCGYSLPRTYREFAKVFGPGEIGQYFRIYSPNHGDRPSKLDFQSNLAFFEKTRSALRTFLGEKDEIGRAIPFADSIGGDVIVWDPMQVTDVNLNEYGIHVITRSETKYVFLVDSFPEFIERVCLGDLFAKRLKFDGWSAVREFLPYGEQPRK